MKRFVIPLVLLTSAALAQDEPAPGIANESEAATAAATEAETAAATESAAPAARAGQPEVRALSGMSILGNEEAPKSLVIVPWKSSKRGDGLDVANALDETPRPVDREVFARELRYFHLRTGGSE